MRNLALLLLLCIAPALVLGCADTVGPDPLPQQPGGYSIIATTDSTLTIAWDAPPDSAAVTGYRVRIISPADDTTVIDFPATTRSAYLFGFKSGQTYIIQLLAQQGERFSEPRTLQWSGERLPLSPVQVTASAVPGSTTAVVQWEAPQDTGIVGYHVWWRGTTHNDTASTDVDATRRSVQLTGLQPDQNYLVGVRSRRGRMLSLPATTIIELIDLPAPEAPTQIGASPIDTTTIAISWNESPSPDVVTYYVLYRTPSGRCPIPCWSTAHRHISETSSTA